jgi:hypothetical protein
MKGNIIWSRYKRLREKHTWPQLLAKIAAKGAEQLFVVHGAVLREREITPDRLKANIENPFILAKEEDIDDSYADLWYSREQAIELIRQGNMLYLWRENGKTLYYQWVMRWSVDIPHLGLRGVKVPDYVGYFATAYVPTEYAGRLIFKRAQKFVEAIGPEFGLQYFFALIDYKADAINRFHEKVLKTRKYQEVLYIKVLLLKIYRVTSADGTSRKWFFNTNSFWNEYSKLLNNKALADHERVLIPSA